LLLLSADDPGCHSSQNEQDNRYFARFAGLPCFEPATAQEAKDMTRDALLLARKLEQPVMLRTTTRINHLRGPVRCGAVAPPASAEYTKKPLRFVPVPAVARARHSGLLEKLAVAGKEADCTPWNRISGKENSRLGIIACGVTRNYLADALTLSGWRDRVRTLELGMSWPLPEKLLDAFLRACGKVLVLEELEALLENDVRAFAHERGIGVAVSGKGGPLTRQGEYSTSLVLEALAAFLGEGYTPARSAPLQPDLPQRPPQLCAGCAHRAVFAAVRDVFGDEAFYSSDIGCYTLGMSPPLRMADFLFCMGSSVSTGSGFAKASGKPVVAFIGDSTFFHSGITGLVNAVFNKHNLLLVILDNGTTAMTGRQPNPGVDAEVLGEDHVHLDIEAVVQGCGVRHHFIVKSYNRKKLVQVLEEMKPLDGVRVIIAREPCVLHARGTLKKIAPQTAHVPVQTPDALAALERLACPAMRYGEDDGVAVDESQCAGCMICLQLSSAFKSRKRGVT
ncbi:MAG: indolepyruvate ferredoxin oxidoreductase subunit alpha, partial [Deltaproteobacteria bacterium]|nr:indolepyruvate ferredoxin oxidoreductase subunit alpha [Deltaproteobacteria bacterium]